MNMKNLRETYPVLIKYLKERNYSHNYVEALRREIVRVLEKGETGDYCSYFEIYRGYEQSKDSKRTLADRLTFLGIIERFDLRGEFPNGRTWQSVKVRGKYQFLSPDFKNVIDNYRDAETKRGVKKANTIHREASSTACFLYELQCVGISAVDAITQKAVIDMFLNEDGSLRRGYTTKKTLATVFKANLHTNTSLFTKIIAYLPALRDNRKNIQYLTDEEMSAVKHVLSESNKTLSLRDKAIGLLALSYGLRGCDIAALRLESIDLDKDIISICQQKTGVPLRLPLITSVGNAIYDYVTSERTGQVKRAETDCEYIFLSENRPFGRLTAVSMGHVALRIMNAAGIRQNVGDSKGLHIFRHRLATDLLGKGVAQPVISKIAGHTSPNSLESYLSADFVHLKECALSIEQFPVAKEVFANA